MSKYEKRIKGNFEETLAGIGDDLVITAIGSGGSSGLIFNYSWGSEDDIVGIVESALNSRESE